MYDFSKIMANKYDGLISAFETKLRKVISEYKRLQTENAHLHNELARKQSDLMMAHKELIELKEKNNHLRVAAGLAANNEERDLAKQRINKLVREIDKCIALINE